MGRLAWMATVLGGSWVVLSGVISRITSDITYIRGLMIPLITTHEPPSVTVIWTFRSRSDRGRAHEPFTETARFRVEDS